MFRYLLLLASLSLSLAFVVFPAAPTIEVACQSIAPPTVISEPGCYMLAADFQTEDPSAGAITITANDVMLVLGSHRLRGAGADSTASGLYAVNADNLFIRGGKIDGFLFGVRADGMGTIDIRDVEIAGGGARGMSIAADRAALVGNSIKHLAGYPGWPASHTIGIELYARICTVRSNRIEEIYPFGVGEAVAISLSAPADACMVSDNRISNKDRPRFGRGIALWLTGDRRPVSATDVKFEHNTVNGYDYAFMAPPRRHHLFSDNVFRIDCLPSDIRTYTEAASSNTFEKTRSCRDLITALEPLATTGGDEWKIRLAAALIEGQWPDGQERMLCDDLKRAKDILIPLVDADIPGAADQIQRIAAADCP